MATNKLVTSSILQYYDNKLKAWVGTQIGEGVSALGQVLRLCGRVNDTTALQAVTDPKAGDVYLVGAEGSESFEEYYYYGNKWEYMGVTRANLEGYITEELLFKGPDGTGTKEAPADGTILAPLVASVRANAAAIEAINNTDTGVLAQSKSYTDEKNTAMDTRVAAVETAVAAINNVDTGAVATAKSYTDEKNTAMDTRVAAVETAIADLATETDIDGLFTGSVT